MCVCVCVCVYDTREFVTLQVDILSSIRLGNYLRKSVHTLRRAHPGLPTIITILTTHTTPTIITIITTRYASAVRILVCVRLSVCVCVLYMMQYVVRNNVHIFVCTRFVHYAVGPM